jgi:hypothetical protein
MRTIAMVAGQCSVEGPQDTKALMAAAEAERARRWADIVDAALAVSPEPPSEQSEQPDLVAAITAAVRKADRDFERVGGSSRHWTRECFLPTLNAAGLMVVPQITPPYPAICRRCNEELRLMNGEWCDRETHTICLHDDQKHEPALPALAVSGEGRTIPQDDEGKD